MQTTLLNDMRPFGVMAHVMVLFAASAGVVYGSEIGALAGLIIGLMYDSVLTTPLGLASLVLGATAYIAGVFPYLVRDSSWWSKIIAVAMASVDCCPCGWCGQPRVRASDAATHEVDA
jgi:rod shape-determining protein MreD